ncbi:MAG: hypothetical protein C4554_09815 [Dethiobacter sp.]|jgi:hypothetical protein|nr:MAG: hypothetical protein C4554_09815 [Dethiobacter sp.]
MILQVLCRKVNESGFELKNLTIRCPSHLGEGHRCFSGKFITPEKSFSDFLTEVIFYGIIIKCLKTLVIFCPD